MDASFIQKHLDNRDYIIYDMRLLMLNTGEPINSWDQDKTFKEFYHPKNV